MKIIYKYIYICIYIYIILYTIDVWYISHRWDWYICLPFYYRICLSCLMPLGMLDRRVGAGPPAMGAGDQRRARHRGAGALGPSAQDFEGILVEAWEFEGEDDQPPRRATGALWTPPGRGARQLRQGLALLAAASAMVQFYPEHVLTDEDDEEVVSEGGLLVIFVLDGYEGSLYIENLFVDPAGFVVLWCTCSVPGQRPSCDVNRLPAASGHFHDQHKHRLQPMARV